MTTKTTKTQLKRLERLAPRVVWTPSAALLEGVMEHVLAGGAAEPADWTKARPDVVAHRKRLLEWVERQHD